MSCEVSTCSGDGDSAFGEAMREPVTSTRCMGTGWVSWAYAACIPNATPPRHIRRIDRDKAFSIIL